MKRKYMTTADRTSLIRYLAWEYGYKPAVKMAKKAEKLNGLYIVPDVFFGAGKKKAQAEGLSQRVREVAAYMTGKLGKPDFGSTVRVVQG